MIYLKALNTLSNFYSLVGREQEYEANYSHLMELYQTKKFWASRVFYLATSEFVTITLTT